MPKDYLGMLECKREDEPRLIQNIILGIPPFIALLNVVSLSREASSFEQE